MENKMDWLLEEVENDYKKVDPPGINSGEEKEGFALHDRAGVSWSLRKIAALEDELAEAQAVADAEMQKICTWFALERAKNDKRIAFYQTVIEEYMKSHEPDQKSVSLPNGKVQWRSTPTQYQHDDAALIDIVPGDYIKTERKLIWGEYKKRLVVDKSGLVVDKETGEVVQGVTATPGEQKMYIKTERAGGKNE